MERLIFINQRNTYIFYPFIVLNFLRSRRHDSVVKSYPDIINGLPAGNNDVEYHISFSENKRICLRLHVTLWIFLISYGIIKVKQKEDDHTGSKKK